MEKAVKEKDQKKLTSLLAKAGNIEDTAKALYLAIQQGFTKGVELILKTNPNLTKSESLELPILTAAKCGASKEIIDLLVQNGSDVNVRDKNRRNRTPLILAAHEGFVETAEALLQHPECDKNAISDPPEKVNRIDHFHTGTTALLTALLQKQKGAPVAEVLIKHGVDFNITAETKSNGKMTALMLAASFGLTTVVEMLLKAGAEVDQIDGSDMTALHWAVFGAQLDMHKEADVIKPLINAGANLEAISNYGGDNITPVLRAVNIGTYLAPIGHDLTKALIEAGSEINRKDMYGKTLLHRAIMCHWSDIIEMLFERGVDVTIVDSIGHCVMYSVAESQPNRPILEKLLDWNCRVDGIYLYTAQCNIRIPNQTLMDIALMDGNLYMVPYLLAAGCPFSRNIYEYEQRVCMESSFFQWLKEQAMKPRTLKNICRITVRRSLPTGRHLESILTTLNVPGNLMKFLLLREGVEIFENMF